MSEERTTIYQLEKETREEVRERAEELLDDPYPEDTLHEIADSNVPIYNSDRVECLLDDLTLAEPDDEGLLGDNKNVFHILGVTIYERLLQAAYQEWEEIKENYVQCEECDKWFDRESEDLDEDEDICKECMEKRIIHNQSEMLAYIEAKDEEEAKKNVYKYTECGAWIQFLDNCIRLGSIVEGSDAEIGPYELTYPFAKEKYDETIKEIEELADEAWNEANSDEEEEENTDWLKEHNLTKEDATCKECGHITTNVEIGWEVETNKNLADFFCDECRHIWRIYIK